MRRGVLASPEGSLSLESESLHGRMVVVRAVSLLKLKIVGEICMEHTLKE